MKNLFIRVGKKSTGKTKKGSTCSPSLGTRAESDEGVFPVRELSLLREATAVGEKPL
jgi:hypothetical protein